MQIERNARRETRLDRDQKQLYHIFELHVQYDVMRSARVYSISSRTQNGENKYKLTKNDEF